MRNPSLALIVTLSLLAGACAQAARTPDRTATASDAAARGLALIEAGNHAFRGGDYREAARRYGAAAVDRPDDAAAFYGLGMALAKLGRDNDARVAYAKARDLAQRAPH